MTSRDIGLIPRKYTQAALYVLALFIATLTAAGLVRYPGKGYIYLVFTAISTAFLYFGFRKRAIFFDTFIGGFLWLGFWLKLTVTVVFANGQFRHPVGAFDGSPEAYDKALIVATTGMLGFLAASLVREKFIFNYPNEIDRTSFRGWFTLYKHNRAIVLWGFVTLVMVVAVTNAYFGIYQRGAVPSTVLPYGLNGIYKWLLLFGLATFSSVILYCEFIQQRKAIYTATFVSLLETFLSNVSLLSRGMILNAGALLYGIYRCWSFLSLKINMRYVLITIVTFGALFVISVILVNLLRLLIYSDPSPYGHLAKEAWSSTMALFVGRWVGIEGVMAVSSYSDLGMGLWGDAWSERFSYDSLSFYDSTIIESPYVNSDLSRTHFVSLPGVVAFSFYSGSFLVLFFTVFVFGLFAAVLERFVFKFGGKNIILCSLLGQVIAYRYAHFGYVPQQSYLLFGSIVLNVILIYVANRALSLWYVKRGILQ